MHQEHLDKKKIKLINSISFLLGFSSAIGAYILSSYFQEITKSDNVGIIYLISYVIIQVIYFSFHRVVKKFGKSRTFYLAIFIQTIILMALSSLPLSWAGLVLAAVYLVISTVAFVANDIMLECFSVDKMSGRIRGYNMTIRNLGFLLGPYLSMWLIDKYGFQGVFAAQFIISFLSLSMAYFGLHKYIGEFKRKISLRQMLVRVSQQRNIIFIFLLSFILNFFYFIMVIYTPIYLRNLGMEWIQIGKIFTIMLLPFVLIQYPAGMIADKKLGEKELIIFSLLIMSPAVLAVYYIESTSILIWGVVLFSTRIGAALLEILTDSYFYKQIDSDDVEIIDFYRSAQSTGNIVAAFLSWAILIFWPVNVIFVFLAFFILLGLYPAFRLKDSRAEQEKSQ